MTINELIKNMTNKNFDIEKELEIKKYIPVMQKKMFAMDVVSECTDAIDNYIAVDRFKMDIYFNMNLLKLYTNLEIATDFYEVVEQYDMLCENGVLGVIIDIIADDYDTLGNILEYELDSILDENSLECQVVKITNKINGILGVISQKIGEVDFNSILPEGADVKQLLDFIDILK